MKKIIILALFLSLLAGCSTNSSTKLTSCTFEDGLVSINLSVESRDNKILTHTAKTVADFTNVDKTQDEIIAIAEDAKKAYESKPGYSFEYNYDASILTETISVDYSKVSFEDLKSDELLALNIDEKDIDKLDKFISTLKEHGFTCE